ncbi:HlyD family secretion protein [Rheinheimera marina]|uniref:HlyD family secretion protein n=1 Tax=Rheinheimera marina TaxID=1774958 RepID=A0ABV9JMB2_9GAMM
MTTNSNASKRWILMGLIPAIAAVAGGFFYLQGGRFVETDNAYVKADKIPLSAQIAGPVTQVLVAENQQVQAGDLLFKIDPAPFELVLQKAVAQRSQVKTELLAQKASYQEKLAEISLAKTKLEYAQKTQRRQADLLKKHYVATNNFDDAEQQVRLAEQQITALQQDLNRISESLGGDPTLPVEQHPSYQVAEAAIAQAQLDLNYTQVTASVTGVVSNLPKPGQYIKAGQSTATLVASEQLWVEANFTEKELTYMQPGQSVEITIDRFPDRTLTGQVQSLSPATGAEFALIPAQNATGNWVKISQRVPVRIELQGSQSADLLAGLSAEVKVDTGHQRQLFGLHL